MLMNCTKCLNPFVVMQRANSDTVLIEPTCSHKQALDDSQRAERKIHFEHELFRLGQVLRTWVFV